MDSKKTDVLIIGSGLAGLYTALNIEPRLKVLMITKEGFDMSNSWLAQGGIAAAVSKEDTPQSHMEDTLVAGAGLCEEQAVRVLVDEGPRDIEYLRKMRVPFDLTEDGELAITREGGHTKDRVVHAGGDATGKETVKVLAAMACAKDNITIWGNCFFNDLIVDEKRLRGAIITKDNKKIIVKTPNIVLATGGLGQIYLHTTNPSGSTGDSLAACVRAGIALKNMEFIQFHPTALYDSSSGSESDFLISEALRGEGALLRNASGHRFMIDKHPMGELAPRDVVARAIVREMESTSRPFVYLDITARSEEFLSNRFPTIYAECERRGIIMWRDMIPVVPVQHYSVGGIDVGLHAQTSIDGLYAVGETACTGVHGANRLASNSMLECLVFGRRAAEHINDSLLDFSSKPLDIVERGACSGYHDGLLREYKRKIKDICHQKIGVIRTYAGLNGGYDEMRCLLEELLSSPIDYRGYYEVVNMVYTALEVFRAAILRKQSCGTHYRVD